MSTDTKVRNTLDLPVRLELGFKSLRENVFLPFVFALLLLTAEDIAIVDSDHNQDYHQNTGNTPDQYHPVGNVCKQNKKETRCV